MRREFHALTSSRLPAIWCLALASLLALGCGGPRTGPGNQNAGNANASQPAPASPAASPESAANGQIEIVSTPPGATIILIETGEGGAGLPQVKGSTPATISVKPGTYEIALEKTGHKAYQKEVKVEANKTAKLNARLR